jgi:hypothetical protein
VPTWDGILEEIQQALAQGAAVPPLDEIRRRYMTSLHQHTGREVILYATK